MPKGHIPNLPKEGTLLSCAVKAVDAVAAHGIAAPPAHPPAPATPPAPGAGGGVPKGLGHGAVVPAAHRIRPTASSNV